MARGVSSEGIALAGNTLNRLGPIAPAMAAWMTSRRERSTEKADADADSNQVDTRALVVVFIVTLQ